MNLIIVSTGRCVWEDVEKIRDQIKTSDVMAVNYMVPFWPRRLKYAVSIHSDFLLKLIDVRIQDQYKNKPITYGVQKRDGLDHYGKFYSGVIRSSGMYAAAIGLFLGYEKIIMAGMPFDDSGYFFDPPNPLGTRKSHDYSYTGHLKKSWGELRDKADGRIKVVSGNLVECFGPY
jgi:hypothetical protein